MQTITVCSLGGFIVPVNVRSLMTCYSVCVCLGVVKAKCSSDLTHATRSIQHSYTACTLSSSRELSPTASIILNHHGLTLLCSSMS